MDSQLAEMERKCRIPKRWLPGDDEYIETRKAFLIEKKTQLRTCLRASVVKRCYLLRMKAKYAGMWVQFDND